MSTTNVAPATLAATGICALMRCSAASAVSPPRCCRRSSCWLWEHVTTTMSARRRLLLVSKSRGMSITCASFLLRCDSLQLGSWYCRHVSGQPAGTMQLGTHSGHNALVSSRWLTTARRQRIQCRKSCQASWRKIGRCEAVFRRLRSAASPNTSAPIFSRSMLCLLYTSPSPRD